MDQPSGLKPETTPLLKQLPFFAALAAVLLVGGYFLSRFDPAVDSHPGNPLSEARTSADLRETQAASADLRARRAALADEVVRGSMSFEQAGCEYRGGEWDRASSYCTLFDPRTGGAL